MKRKALSLILAFAMAVSLFTVGASAAEPTYGDTAGHWAEASIERWSAYGIIQGSNGQFDPNGQLTCAQLATILAKLLKLPAAKDAGFSDNKADAWYYDAINRCAAAGILNGNGDGTVTPEAPITRERAMVMLARALGIEPLRNPDLTRYTDAAQVSAYAQGYVAALIEAGIVGGVTAGELAPQDNINRASTVTILDRAISTYADQAGATVNADGKGIVLVVAENVKITGAPEGTKIVVADGATGLSVNGKSVSDGQTYIVPSTVIGIIASGGIYTPPAQHTHTWNEGVVTKEPTCTEAGVKTYTCTVCKETKTEAIEALGHDWNEPTVVYAANGNNGTKTYTCKRQGCAGTKTEDIDWKFYLSAISGNTVDMTVGEDYTAVFTLPNGENKSVDAASVTLTAKMQNVGSLGVTGVREHSVTINTGIAGVTADLETSLSNCYGFNGMTVNATIGGKACTYNFSACEDGKITATTDTEAARAAWQELTSYVTASTQEANDSYILVANGSTMQIRKELLKFEKEEDLKLDNFSEMNTLMQNVKDHVQLVASDDDFGGIKILIKTGTQLAVGQSVATLNQDVTVEVTSDDMTVREDILSNLRTLVNTGKDNKALVLGAVQMFNELVGQMNGKTINVTIQTIQ